MPQLFSGCSEMENVSDKVNQCVIPGDVVGRVIGGLEIKIGPGLKQNNTNIVATKAGILQFRHPNKFWVENSQRRVRFFRHINSR